MPFNKRISKGEMQEWLKSAACSTVNRIRRDGDKAPEGAGHVFTYLEGKLFSQSLDVNQLSRVCGKHPNSIAAVFRQTAGITPHRYIAARRLETAAALLLRHGELENWMIAELIGYSNGSVFCRNFRNWAGMTARTFHERAQRLFAGAGLGPCCQVGDMEELCKAIASGLDSPEATAAVERLKSRNSLIERSRVPSAVGEYYRSIKVDFSEEMLGIIKCEELWAILQEKPWAMQRQIVREYCFCGDTSFFHYLRERSAPEGRGNRKYGVHLAELALESLRATEQCIGEELPNLTCRGWAWLGNARRLAFDFPGAEEAFSIAEAYLIHLENEAPLAAEVYDLKSAFRRWQRRFAEALALNKKALAVFRSRGTTKQILWALLEKANINEHVGDIDTCVLSLYEALEYIDEAADVYLKYAAFFNLASALARTGAFQEAFELLPTVRELSEEGDKSQEASCLLLWLEGYIRNGLGDAALAEQLLLEARNGYLGINSIGCASLAALDLAALYHGQNRNEEVMQLTTSVIPIFESLKVHKESNGALMLLRDAVAKNEMTSVVIQEVRDRLERIRLDPIVDFNSAEVRVFTDPLPKRPANNL